MVLLTITPAVAEALQKWNGETAKAAHEEAAEVFVQAEPSLDDPAVGKPISHGQIVDLWKRSKSHGESEYTLENLLRGAKVYVAPPPPKPEKSNEYKALMARLRRDEEERQYQRMTNPAVPLDSFSQRFPTTTAMAHSFAEVNRSSNIDDLGDDDVTYNDVHRQMMLVINFIVTILGCAMTLWILARWWSTPARLFLTMGGSLVIAIAEVTLYATYVWHLTDANKNEKKIKEVKEIVQTWVVGGDPEKEGLQDTIMIDQREEVDQTNVRRRKKDPA